MRRFRTYLEVVAIALIFAFAFGVMVPIFWSLGSEMPVETSTVFVGAFLGAFLSYLLVRVGIALDAVYARHAKHRAALIKAQHTLNSALTVIGDDIFVADNYMKIFDGYSAESEPRVFGNVFHPIPYDNALLYDLANVEVLNQLFGLHVDYRKLNDSMDTVNRMVGKITDAFIQHHVDHQAYCANVENDKPRYLEIKKFLEAASELTIATLAVVRALSKHEPPLSKFIRWTLPREMSKSQRREIANEEQALRAEIETNAESARRRIVGISGKK